MKQAAFIFPLFLATCGVAGAGPAEMQPGLWEITTEIDMPGMPMKMPPQVMRHCYTAADLANGEKALPQSGDSSCRIRDYQVKGNTVTWGMECSGANAMQGTASMTTSRTSYSGQMKSVMGGPSGGMEMTTRWQGRRIGDCP